MKYTFNKNLIKSFSNNFNVGKFIDEFKNKNSRLLPHGLKITNDLNKISFVDEDDLNPVDFEFIIEQNDNDIIIKITKLFGNLMAADICFMSAYDIIRKLGFNKIHFRCSDDVDYEVYSSLMEGMENTSRYHFDWE